MIEILVSIALLVLISFSIYQLTKSTASLRVRLQTDGDFYSDLRMATSVMEKDFSHIFTPTSLQPPEPTTVPGAPPTSPPAPLPEAPTSEFWGAYINTSGMRHARFQGSANRVSFVGASHVRMYKEARESIFSKITYRLESDPSATDELKDTQILKKIEDTDVFNSEDKDDAKTIKQQNLLYGIKQFKIRYYFKNKDAWFNEWDSDKDDYKNLMPDLVEITVEIIGKERHSYDGIYVFKPEVPNKSIPSFF